MYTYNMERTQIYLTRAQAAALDDEARRKGTTRSHLIREAITERYGGQPHADRVTSALRATAGLWSHLSLSGEEYVAELRSGSRLTEAGPESATEADTAPP
jgi:hypothetical protein